MLRLFMYSIWFLVCYVYMLYVKMCFDGEFMFMLKVYVYALFCGGVCIVRGLYIYIYV